MNIFALADTHLSLNSGKSMEVFGATWTGYTEKIKKSAEEKLSDEDLLLLPGDLSWAMQLEEAGQDLAFLNDLPGQKVLLRGNHDFWWSTPNKLRCFFREKGLDKLAVLQNDTLHYRDEQDRRRILISGSRLWALSREWKNKQDEKIYVRELHRLRLSLEAGRALRETFLAQGETLVWICMTHYPPADLRQKDTPAQRLLLEYPIDLVIYGHLHSHAHKKALCGLNEGLLYQCVSADYLRFSLADLDALLAARKEADLTRATGARD